jgi:transcriptional regulator with XRE-family HTH domain
MYMDREHVSLRQFAKRCGSDVAHVHRILRGVSSPSVSLLVKMSDVSGVSCDVLARQHLRMRERAL